MLWIKLHQPNNISPHLLDWLACFDIFQDVALKAYLYYLLYTCCVQFLRVKYGCNSSSPSPVTLNFNHMNILWYEQNHHLERKYPSFAPLGIFNFFVISFTFILSLFMMILHLCNSVRYVTFTTNLTLNRKKKSISRLPQSSMTFVSLLLFGLLSAESAENYFSFLIILWLKIS